MSRLYSTKAPLDAFEISDAPFCLGYCCISTFIKLQTGWSLDQDPDLGFSLFASSS